MNLSEFFEDWFGAKLRNARWSWGAYDEKRDRVLLRVWEDQVELRDGSEFVLVLEKGRERTSQGLPEREEHLERMRAGSAGYAVVCRAKSTEVSGSRAVAGFEREFVLKLGTLVGDGPRVLARIEARIPMLEFSPKQGGFSTWIFQANPKQYNVRQALLTYEKLHWRVTRYKSRMSTGDFVYLWESGADGGVLAQARILCQPTELPFGPGDEFIVDGKKETEKNDLQVLLRIEAVLQEPLDRNSILANPELAKMQIIAQPQGTNFRMTDLEARELAFLFSQHGVMPPLQFLRQADPDDEESPVARYLKLVEAMSRSSKVRELVKKVNGYRCQFCSAKLETPNGPYAEGAHIQPIGRPHNGPDTTQNMLCLCPNCHVLFDSGAVTVDENGWVLGLDKKVKLAQSAGHEISEKCLEYHREKIFVKSQRCGL